MDIHTRVLFLEDTAQSGPVQPGPVGQPASATGHGMAGLDRKDRTGA